MSEEKAIQEVEPEATLPIGPISCPRCNVEMTTVTFEDVEIDRCPKCLAIWFDMHEQEELRNIKGSEAIDIGSKGATATQDFNALKCPRCKVPMYMTRDLQQTHIVFEKCMVCYGVFFDAGEFTDFKHVSFLEYLRIRFTQ